LKIDKHTISEFMCKELIVLLLKMNQFLAYGFIDSPYKIYVLGNNGFKI